MMVLRSSVLLAALLREAGACTNMLVSAGATTDGTTHIAYNADDGGLYVRPLLSPLSPLSLVAAGPGHRTADANANG
jgi:hypothetical protein